MDQAQIVAIATAVAQAQTIAQAQIRAQPPQETRARSSASSDNKGQAGSLLDYLDFSGVVDDKDAILDILLSNGVDQFYLFKGAHLTHNQLIPTGLNIGTIAKLQAFVNKYKQHLVSSTLA
jgi:hypothetical protein